MQSRGILTTKRRTLDSKSLSSIPSADALQPANYEFTQAAMLSESVSAVVDLLTRETAFSLLPFLGVGAALLCWRLWRFTIMPVMNPSAPKELPYWIPCTPRLATIGLQPC